MDKFVIRRAPAAAKRPREELEGGAAAEGSVGVGTGVGTGAGAGGAGAGAGASAGGAPSPAPASLAAAAQVLALGVDTSSSDWAPLLLREAQRAGWGSTLAALARARSKGTVFPPPGLELAALRHTPLSSVRCVILGQDPYHGPGQACGLSFAVPEGVAAPPSLRNILQELADDVGGGARGVCSDLLAWARGGVLLLNTVLTVDSGAPASHAAFGWGAFTDAVIAHVAAHTRVCVFVLWGKFASAKKDLILRSARSGSAAGGGAPRHLILEAPHPSPLSAHRGFFGSKPFSRTNTFLVANGAEPVAWV